MPGEVAIVEVAADEWVMKLDGSSTANSGGARVVLYHGEGETIRVYTYAGRGFPWPLFSKNKFICL